MGAFRKGKRITEIDAVTKSAKSTPGPANYKPKPVGFNKILGGKTDQAPSSNYLTHCQFSGRQTPGVGKYKPNNSFTARSTPSLKWQKPAAYKKPEREKVGPGSYDPAKAQIENKSPTKRFTIGRAKTPNIYVTKEKNHVPGVGQYKTDIAEKKIWKGFSIRRR